MIKSDQVVALDGIAKARLLIDHENNAAVFTSLTGPPTRVFRIASTPRPGTLILDDGSTLRFRVTGSSCAWSLAKCRVSTAQLAARWTS